MQSIIESMLVPYIVLLWKTHVEVGYSHIQELINFLIKSSLYSNYMGRTPINQLLGKVCNLEFLGQIIKMCYLLCLQAFTSSRLQNPPLIQIFDIMTKLLNYLKKFWRYDTHNRGHTTILKIMN